MDSSSYDYLHLLNPNFKILLFDYRNWIVSFLKKYNLLFD
jgi:hypothetical protein